MGNSYTEKMGALEYTHEGGSSSKAEGANRYRSRETHVMKKMGIKHTDNSQDMWVIRSGERKGRENGRNKIIAREGIRYLKNDVCCF